MTAVAPGEDQRQGEPKAEGPGGCVATEPERSRRSGNTKSD
ncbi:MAG: hypothetical protein VKK80_02995 [Prochlorothrix sp.]|nr:hypothetical protein [Prochlorothrix sp.]